MKKITKSILTVSLILLITGGVIFAAGTALGGRSGIGFTSEGIVSPASEATYYSKEKTKLDKFDSIDINLNYADLKILPSDGYYIEYKLSGNPSLLSLNVSSGKLTIEQKSEPVMLSFWIADPLSFENCYMNLYVPEDQYYKTVYIINHSGDVTFDDLNCESANLTLEYGDLKGKSLTCSGETAIKLDSGDSDIEKAELGVLDMTNNYGDIEFREITAKQASFKLDSGDLGLKAASFEKADFENSYGDIRVKLEPSPDEYNFDVSTEYGSVTVAGYENTRIDYDEESLTTHEQRNRLITAHCDSGDVLIN